MRTLNLNNLSAENSGLTKQIGAYLAQGAAFMLELYGHSNGVVLSCEGEFLENINLEWSQKIDGKVRRNWNDSIEATEYGAAGVALSLLIELTGLMVVERSFIGSGVDYFLGELDASSPDGIKRTFRVEVSGIGVETNNNSVQKRIKEKLNQVGKQAIFNNPAYIAVIEFKTPKSKIIRNDRSKDTA